ncbi:MAG TPA: hypothetical protein VF886_12480 [Roseiarcus sp.]|jgi:hypothetical protein
MSAIESDELAKRTNAAIFAILPSSVTAGGRVHRLERSLPEQAFDKRVRGSMIEHEPIVPRQGQPESAQIREVNQTVA